MTTAVDPNIDTVPEKNPDEKGSGDEEEIEPKMSFREYM